MKRIVTWISLLAVMLALWAPAQAQTASDYNQGVDVAGSTATIWFAPTGTTTTWVDVHYVLNGGVQQNIRMTYNSANARYETAVSPVSTGSNLSYSFTYNKGSPAYDSATYAYTVNGDTGGGTGSGGGGGGGSGSWNGQTTFHIVNQTNGHWADSQVYWAIIGKSWSTGQFVYVDASGNLQPMSTADNGALVKNGVGYTNYFHTIAQMGSVTIPPINSARILFSVGSPMYIRVVVDGNGNIGYAGANIENPTDPNIDVYFDFGEMAILPPGSGNPGIFVNTTRVDQFGFPLKLHVQGLNGYDQTVGEPLTESRSQLFSDFQSSLPSAFASLAQSQAPYRILAPAHGSFGSGQPNANYLQSYIDAVWNQFRSQNLVFTLDNLGTFTGHVYGNTFVFTGGNANGTYYINGEPTTSEVLLGNGLLNDASGASDVGTQLQIQAQLCAALNRHVAANPSLWYDQFAHYPAGTLANWYAKFWHDHSIDAKAYGFAYDDVGGFSPSLHTAAPTDVTFTIGW
ncbi:glycoside hydrolase family 64 protein [Oleiagrimonas soli]|uniref:Beta-1,3-glucanase N-terminal domain-containing protein n=1 Tax=Oleiagrimonas soli TaxID=1543381 RepID=A0A841KBU6_9GAMM|nr:glycoside hydrolase family 64 protein [Oleiagrimonas soli]MBB6183063.1 hypothetical protein [Oleiagrimonas soli]